MVNRLLKTGITQTPSTETLTQAFQKRFEAQCVNRDYGVMSKLLEEV
ncbi:hypothetical protein OC187_01325 [Anaplasma capra]|nr:hypothetical protein [Anaplasma capra]